jgi:hypothetical protein
VFSLLFFFKKRFSLLFFYKVFSLLVFLTKCSHWFFLQSVLIVVFFTSVLIVVFFTKVLIVVFLVKCSHCCFFFYKVFSLIFFLVFTKFFVCFYDIKNNYTRKCCARNSWFFSTILHFYHIRPSTNFWLFVCCNPTD